MRKLIMTRVGIAAIAMAACVATSAQGTRLMGDEMKSFVPGKSFTGLAQRGGTWEVKYNPDGTFKVWVHNSDWNDSGTWEIKDDQMCSERTKKAYTCSDFFRVTNTEYYWVDSRGQITKAKLEN